ncbi:hypothetical protein DAPPUDRAFT_50372, partial [Daphnia pulex]
GSIISPNYPTGYKNDESCGLFLTAENGNRIAVVIHHVDTEAGYDVLTIRDGVTEESPVLVELSDLVDNLTVLSTQPSIFVGFTSDSAICFRGFNASWTQVNLLPHHAGYGTKKTQTERQLSQANVFVTSLLVAYQ